MTRSYCPTPTACTAPKRGPCSCQIDVLVRAKMSAARKKALADPAVREKLSAACKKAWADPAVRAKMSAASKKAWALKAIPGRR